MVVSVDVEKDNTFPAKAENVNKKQKDAIVRIFFIVFI
jgi:hypothetical protein